MANDVFANGREVSCKKADGKSICAFPDVCMTPPENPVTPPGVPVPYPNTGMAKDMTSGSKKVKVSGKEVMLKNKSYFKKSIGDEAGSAAKKGVVTSVNRGKVYFISWSMDVKFEGENIVRHLDMTTHNHASPITNTPPWLYKDSAMTDPGKCKEEAKAVENNCTNKTYKDDMSGACCDAKKCVVAPYGSQPDCCDGKTKHHVIPDHCFKDPGDRDYYEGFDEMTYNSGAGLCVHGIDKNNKRKQHGRIHTEFDDIEGDQPNNTWTYGKAREKAVEVCAGVTGCNADCLDQQIKQYNKQRFGFSNDKAKLRADPSGKVDNLDRSMMGMNAV